MSYFDSFNHHIEKVDSCITDLQYVFKDPTDIVARENFQKCYNIMTDVRALGRYLCGNPMIGSKPLFDSFHNEDGSCKGEDIEMIFRALYAKFIDGCLLTSTAERMKHNNSSTLYRDECLGMNKNITDYMTNFYMANASNYRALRFMHVYPPCLKISRKLTLLQFTAFCSVTTLGCSSML